jgi:DNA (cytosine-5)-methyltransferase 1
LKYNYSVRDALPWIKRVRYGGHIYNWKDATMNAAGTVVQSDSTTSPTAYLSAGGWVEAEADISRYAIGDEWDNLKEGEQSSKYFQLVKPSLANPSPTITQLGGDNTVASVTHPTEKRKFSIAELKRICAFPDDFVLTGTYAQQWERLGRAVPPVMMMHIASAIRDKILCKIK